MRTSYMTIR